MSGFDGPAVWLVSGKPNLFTEKPDPTNMPQVPFFLHLAFLTALIVL